MGIYLVRATWVSGIPNPGVAPVGRLAKYAATAGRAFIA